MRYKYITDNNLYDKQNYMYSEYGGQDFLCSYVETRKTLLGCIQNNPNSDMKISMGQQSSRTQKRLYDLQKVLRKGKFDKTAMDLIDAYVKSFEVRKRLYTDYSLDWKPVERNFEDYDAYLIFAECLLMAYKHSECLKYFSCLLKLDDTLLSVANQLDYRQGQCLCKIIEAELEIFYKLADSMEVQT